MLNSQQKNALAVFSTLVPTRNIGFLGVSSGPVGDVCELQTFDKAMFHTSACMLLTIHHSTCQTSFRYIRY